MLKKCWKTITFILAPLAMIATIYKLDQAKSVCNFTIGFLSEVWDFLISLWTLSLPVWILLSIPILLFVIAIIVIAIVATFSGGSMTDTSEEDVFGFKCKHKRNIITGEWNLQYLCPKCDMELEQRPSGCDDIFLLVCTHCKEILPVDRVFGEENLDLKVTKEIERRKRVQQKRRKEGK